MEALKPVLQQSISPLVKTATASTQGQVIFASLLESLNVEAELPNTEQEPAGTMLENLEILLNSLQELSVEDQPAEMQEIQYAVIHLEELQSKIQQPIFGVSTRTTENAENTTDFNSKLIELLEKIQQKLQTLTETIPKEVHKVSEFAESEVNKNTLSFSEITQIYKQLDKLLSMFEQGAQTKKGIEESKALPEVPRFVSEVLKPVKETSKVAVDMQETIEKSAVQPVSKINTGEELQTPKIPAEVKATQETPSQALASITGDVSKVTASVARTEASPQTAPFVRLENLLEDLGGMLKSSMRLAETQEGMKMRVNIFPEHLGHLEILLTSTNGKLAAQIMASTPMAKEALDLQLNQLRMSLVQQGVDVEKIEVLQQTSQQSFNQQQSQSGQRFTQPQQRNGKANDSNGYLPVEDEKRAEQQSLIGDMIKVDYTV